MGYSQNGELNCFEYVVTVLFGFRFVKHCGSYDLTFVVMRCLVLGCG